MDMVLRFKWLIVTLVVLLSVSICTISWWIGHRDELSAMSGDLMYRAVLSNSDKNESITILNEVANDSKSKNYSYLAQFKLASIHGSESVEKAREIYSKIADDKKVDPVFKELAEYLEILALLKEDNKKLVKIKLDGLLKKKNNVYPSSVKEIAVISMIQDNNIDGAVNLLKEMNSDLHIDPTVRKNTVELLQIYSDSK